VPDAVSACIHGTPTTGTIGDGPVGFSAAVQIVIGAATPDVERDLAERRRAYHHGMDAYGTTRPASA
jgi:hypothetical protein